MPAIPNSGAISLADFAAEFGGTAPHSMSEYYRDGGNVPSNNSNVPTAGAFRFGQMRGAINAIINTLANTTNVNLATVFGDNWASSVPKEIIIPSGVTIGGTGSSDALIAPSGMGGTLTITNAGNIIGFGGAVASAGGNAINIASANITVANSGLIAGGGGGGGSGGQGGQGGSGSSDAGYDSAVIKGSCGQCSSVPTTGTGSACGGSKISIYSRCFTQSCCMGEGSNGLCEFHCHNPQSGGAGGAGGSGGVGQGYNQTNANGSAGGAGSNGAGSAGAGGAGGAGGNGATYGTAGSSGATGSTGANGGISNGVAGSGGASGGAAGAAVIYSVAYTMNNTGTVAGVA